VRIDSKIAIGLCGVLVVLVAGGCASAQSSLPGNAPPSAEPFEGAVSIASDPLFGNQQETLKKLVQKKGKRGANELCVIGQDIAGGDRQAWVSWKQDQSIILWEAPVSGTADLALSRRYLNLRTDIAADPQGSTFIVIPAWVASLRKACDEIGQRFTIVKQ
jgi:hypothetical protein